MQINFHFAKMQSFLKRYRSIVIPTTISLLIIICLSIIYVFLKVRKVEEEAKEGIPTEENMEEEGATIYKGNEEVRPFYRTYLETSSKIFTSVAPRGKYWFIKEGDLWYYDFSSSLTTRFTNSNEFSNITINPTFLHFILSPDQSLLAMISEDKVRIFSFSEKKFIYVSETYVSGVSGLVWKSNEEFVFNEGTKLILFNMEDNSEKVIVQNLEDSGNTFVYESNYIFYVSCCREVGRNSITKIDLSNFEKTVIFEVGKRDLAIRSIFLLQDARFLVIVEKLSGSFYFLYVGSNGEVLEDYIEGFGAEFPKILLNGDLILGGNDVYDEDRYFVKELYPVGDCTESIHFNYSVEPISISSSFLLVTEWHCEPQDDEPQAYYIIHDRYYIRDIFSDEEIGLPGLIAYGFYTD